MRKVLLRGVAASFYGAMLFAGFALADATSQLQLNRAAEQGYLQALGQALDGLQNGTGLATGSITGTHILDDTIDSADYAAGSIDNEHVADDQIDSEHYAAASIDNEHLADNAVDSAELAAGAVDATHLADVWNAEKDFTHTNAGTGNEEPINFATTCSGPGATGCRVNFNSTITASMGSWSNALKGQVTYGAGGDTTGLGSAIVAEAVMGPDSDQGNFGVLELEFGAPDASVNPALSSFIHATAYGDTEELAALDLDLALFSLQGVTDGAGNMFDTFTEEVAAAINGALRIRIGAATWYIPLCDAADCS